jgi:hypothetical protein
MEELSMVNEKVSIMQWSNDLKKTSSKQQKIKCWKHEF